MQRNNPNRKTFSIVTADEYLIERLEDERRGIWNRVGSSHLILNQGTTNLGLLVCLKWHLRNRVIIELKVETSICDWDAYIVMHRCSLLIIFELMSSIVGSVDPECNLFMVYRNQETVFIQYFPLQDP